MKTDIEIEEKINECIENKTKHVEWLCQNKTEKQLEQLLIRIENLYEFTVRKQMTRDADLINLWKDAVNTAIEYRSSFENLYVILKKMKKYKKLTSYEKMIVDINYPWFRHRIYDL
jgi:hypothetical protein